jgi:hypothetical protein
MLGSSSLVVCASLDLGVWGGVGGCKLHGYMSATTTAALLTKREHPHCDVVSSLCRGARGRACEQSGSTAAGEAFTEALAGSCHGSLLTTPSSRCSSRRRYISGRACGAQGATGQLTFSSSSSSSSLRSGGGWGANQVAPRQVDFSCCGSSSGGCNSSRRWLRGFCAYGLAQ